MLKKVILMAVGVFTLTAFLFTQERETPTTVMTVTPLSFNIPKVVPKPSQVMLDVPIISQLPELPTGCEITSLAMLFSCKGIIIGKELLAQEMPYSDNPDVGFSGSPWLASGGSINPQGLSGLITQYLGSYSYPTDLEGTLVSGKPILVWLPLYGFTTHTVLLVGYDQEYFYFNDPWTGEKQKAMGKDEFYRLWEALGLKALSY